MTNPTLTKAHLEELIARARAGLPPAKKKEGKEWNEQQQQAIDLAMSGKSFCLIGAAGTGKTTTELGIVQALISSGKVGPLMSGTKWLRSGSPGIVATSFTRRAVRNQRKAMSADMTANCLTHHKLLEFAPVYYEVLDETTQQYKTTMRFEPSRTRLNPLPSSIKTVLWDESSMTSTELFTKVISASPSNVQHIFIGDLHQLPPVYGKAILGYKLFELPVIELTHVYRQALESPIIALAHRIKDGPPLKGKEAKEHYEKETPAGKVEIKYWVKSTSEETALRAAQAFCKKAAHEIDWDETVILCPWDKEHRFGNIELNKAIAGELSKKAGNPTYEVIAGYAKHYLAVGDRVLYDKEDCVVTEIVKNGNYVGKRPRAHSIHMDRWGMMQDGIVAKEEEMAVDFETFLSKLDATSVEDRKQEASHIVHLRVLEDDTEVLLDKAGEFNSMIFSYAMTVHKSQGSEWKKVICFFHSCHNRNINRELLYTAVTRAKEELLIVCEEKTFLTGIQNQAIKGQTWQEKAEAFKKYAEENSLADMLEASNNNKPKLVRLQDLVTEEMKERAQEKLNHYWAKAKGKEKPTLSFDLRARNIIGRATYGKNTITLNPVFLSCGDPEIEEYMLNNTMAHEVAHIVAFQIYKARGHDWYWRTIFSKLGFQPSRLATIGFPDHLATKLQVLANHDQLIEEKGESE
jgi:ABC-type oligopeptide transport system ATPase subunit